MNDFYPDQLKKFCVFCGERPSEKTKEHVIPLWLIEMTGDPNRVIPLVMNKNTYSISRQSASSFTFPACNTCNNAYSDLEGRVSSVVRKVLANQDLGEAEISDLMDWLDKVRIGLWLGDMQRNKEHVFVQRHFHINDRVGKKDRCAFLFKANDNKMGFSMSGVFTPMFHFTPSCFSLSINNLYIINVSHDFLFMHRLGFPRFTDRFLDGEGKIGGNFKLGNNGVRLPIWDYRIRPHHISFFQPCITEEVFQNKDAKEVFSCNYVDENLISQLKGKIFLENGERWPSEPTSIGYDSLQSYDREYLHYEIPFLVMDIQNWLTDRFLPSMDGLSKEARISWKKIIQSAKDFNNVCKSQLKDKINIYINYGETI